MRAAALALLIAAPAWGGEVIQGRAVAIDGDTIRIGQERVRIADLDAPELGTRAGEAAKARMAALIQGQVVTCQVRAWQKRKGSYPPRAIATCSAGGRDLAGALAR